MADALHQLAIVLKPPGADYLSWLERTRSAIAPHSIEAARQLDVFIQRIHDLSSDEFVKLYDETFTGDLTPARDLALTLATRPLANEEIVSVSNLLPSLLERLEADRNPFAVVGEGVISLAGSAERLESPRPVANRLQRELKITGR